MPPGADYGWRAWRGRIGDVWMRRPICLRQCITRRWAAHGALLQVSNAGASVGGHRRGFTPTRALPPPACALAKGGRNDAQDASPRRLANIGFPGLILGATGDAKRRTNDAPTTHFWRCPEAGGQEACEKESPAPTQAVRAFQEFKERGRCGPNSPDRRGRCMPVCCVLLV